MFKWKNRDRIQNELYEVPAGSEKCSCGCGYASKMCPNLLKQVKKEEKENPFGSSSFNITLKLDD